MGKDRTDRDGSPRRKSSRAHRGSRRDDDRDRSRSRSRGRDARRDSGRDRDRDRDGHHHHHHHHRSSRTHHEQHHHHHSSNNKQSRHDRRDNRTTTTKDDARTRGGRGGRGNRQGPSSSIGPGRVEGVLLAILILLGITSAVFISLSIWLYAVRDGWPSGLNQTGSLTWTRLISYATALLLVGLLLIPVIATAVVSAVTTTGSSARRSRLTLILLCGTGIVILLMMTVTSLLFVSNGGPKFIDDALEQSWENTVESSNYLAACRLQNANGCFGWKDNSCLGCRPTVDGNDTGCHPSQYSVCPRCFRSTPARRVTSMAGGGDAPVSAVGVGGGAQLSDVVVVNPRLGVRRRLRQQRPLRTRRRVAVAGGTGAFSAGVGATAALGRRVRRAWESVIGRGLMPIGRQTTQDYELGCRRWVIWRNREFFIPMTVYTIFLILLLTLLMWKACIDSSGRYTR